MHALLLALAIAMPRNVYLDVEAIVGARLHSCEIAQDTDRKLLHCIVGHNRNILNYRASAPHLAETEVDWPIGMERPGRRPNSKAAKVPARATGLDRPGLRRHLVIDLEVALGAKLHHAVVVPKRDPVADMLPPEVERPPPTSFFIHALIEADAERDVSHMLLRARGYLDQVPEELRRADGGPLHVFLGVSTDRPPEPVEE